MTYLILAQQKILTLPFIQEHFFRHKPIYEIIRTGIFSSILVGLIIISMLIYAVALYATFDLGFQIRKNSVDLSAAKLGLEEKELEVQSLLSSFASEHKIVLESMEKVSAMNFIIPSSFVASQFSGQIP